MSNFYNKVALDTDSANFDAFARLRTSEPQTIFDSKQIHNAGGLLWDDQEVSGSGTSSTWSQQNAHVDMAVTANTAGKRIRQTYMRFNYQPGKSQLVLLTGYLNNPTATGVQRCMGLFDDNNGIFAKNDNGTIKFVVRSSVSGSVVDTEVAQSDWNIDKMDGSGNSGITLDGSKSQILIIDFEWLGVGRVRMGWVINGIPIYTHQFLHANVGTSVYMSTPNLPIRYEIENDGTGEAASVYHICSTIISEGGQQDIGVTHAASTEAEHINANTAGTYYAVFGIRLKSANLDGIVKLERINVLIDTADDFHWEIRMNPTVAGTPVWASHGTHSVIDQATGDTAGSPSVTVITGGHVIDSGYVKAGNNTGSVALTTRSQLRLGSAIDGTPDELWLIAMPLSSNADIHGGLSWQEVS